jgi:hypothetical protein
MNRERRDNLILKIASDIEVIKHDLAQDFRILHGNGKPGLIEEVQELKTQVQLLKQSQAGWKQILHYVGSIISGGLVGWLTGKIS